MKSLRIEVSDELYDRYFGPSIGPTSVNKDDLKTLGAAFLNSESLVKIYSSVKPDEPKPSLKEVEDYVDKVVADIDKKAYIVTADGWKSGYGAEIYLIGVYYSKELAERIAKKNKGSVTEIETNKEFPLEKGDPYWGDMRNQYYLGGYYE